VAAILWWLLTAGFEFYVSITSRANAATAAVGAALLALTWIWMAAQVLLIGGTVNFLYGQRRSIPRERMSWGERIAWGTGEIRKVVVSDNGGDGATSGGTDGADGAGQADQARGIVSG
jgi:hypothetical protein